ncbi:MAG: hypothetical protein HY650_07015 [Acidobacteria bacterium]|nr:hypothetical protein [Acidobacteriota bacterium]
MKECREALGPEWPSEIYRREVLTGRTRRFEFAVITRPSAIRIVHSLLGVELKLGRTRVTVPDLQTARYLQVFARLGVTEVAVPYDITRIAGLADRLESAFQRIGLLAAGDQHPPRTSSGESLCRRIRRVLRLELNRLSDTGTETKRRFK